MEKELYNYYKDATEVVCKDWGLKYVSCLGVLYNSKFHPKITYCSDKDIDYIKKDVEQLKKLGFDAFLFIKIENYEVIEILNNDDLVTKE